MAGRSEKAVGGYDAGAREIGTPLVDPASEVIVSPPADWGNDPGCREAGIPVEQTPLFEREIIGLAAHNVGSLFDRSNRELAARINHYYGTRAGHIPPGERTGVLVPEATTSVTEQMAYLSGLYHSEIEVLTHQDLKSMSAEERKKMLVVPYVRDEITDRTLSELGISVWGLPPNMVHLLKNKADSHLLALEAGIELIKPPDFTICHINDLVDCAGAFSAQIEAKYLQVGMSGYPPDLMLRTAEGDGGYGCCELHFLNSQVRCIPDGDPNQEEVFGNKQAALEFAQRNLREKMDPRSESRVVISRFIDVADSPGMSVVVSGGEVVSLGWNGQVTPEGGSACIGTSTYHPTTDYLAIFQDTFEEATAESFALFLKLAADKIGLNFDQLTGLASVDLMIPGPREIKFQKEYHHREPRPLMAEVNPRFTNLTDAEFLSIWINGRDFSPRGMRDTVERGILTNDKLPLPNGMSMAEVRDEIGELDHRLQQDGTRVVLRMPGEGKIGVVFTGDVKRAEKELRGVISGF